MSSVRCTICRHQMANLKSLAFHYFFEHSKLKIIKQLLRTNILQTTPNFLKAKRRIMRRKIFKKAQECIKTETVYLKENVHILCSQKEIVISDGKNSVMEFSFDDNSSESKENRSVPLRDCNQNKLPKKKKRVLKRKILKSPSSVSSEDSYKNRKVKQKFKRGKKTKQSGYYHINITQLRDQQSLDEKTGEFYKCHCRETTMSYRPSDLKIITSDTESCSDTGKNLSESGVFCYKCGNGYKTKLELEEHMTVHETFCRLCNESFPSEMTFRDHMRMHFFKVFICHICGREFPFRELMQIHFERHYEDNTFEKVLDMEEDYSLQTYNFCNFNYNCSINSILYFLNEHPRYQEYCCDYDKYNNIQSLAPY